MTVQIRLEAELSFEPSEDALLELWREKNPEREDPEDLEALDTYDALVTELAEKAVHGFEGIYIGCGNGSTGGLLCAGVVEGGTLEFEDFSVTEVDQ